jgi:hypothetical protein
MMRIPYRYCFYMGLMGLLLLALAFLKGPPHFLVASALSGLGGMFCSLGFATFFQVRHKRKAQPSLEEVSSYSHLQLTNPPPAVFSFMEREGIEPVELLSAYHNDLGYHYSALFTWEEGQRINTFLTERILREKELHRGQTD